MTTLYKLLAATCLLGALLPRAQVHASANDCLEAPAAVASEGAAAPGRQLLGQGIALFDAKNFKMAERALQSALFAGLPDRQERASAHKYLAFVFCSNSEWARCESEFDAAFLARPSFALEAYEMQNTPWRDAYLRSQNRWASRCGRPALASSGGGAAVAASGFPLSSSVIVAITPLPQAPAGTRLAAPPAAEHETRSNSNVRLRVSPWAIVQIDGKRLGVTPPLTQLSLAAGARTVELSNPGFETVRRVIQVVNGKTVTITHDFDSR